MDIKEILKGWGNLIIRPEALEPEAKRRFIICNTCSTRTGIMCDKKKGGCGCVLVAKTRSESKCPKDKW